MMSIFIDVKTLIDEPGTGVFWVDQQVYDAINEAQIETYAKTKWSTTTATLTATASVEFVDIPATLMIPQYYLGTGGKSFLTSKVQLENWNRQWRLEPEAYPKYMTVFDEDRLMPVPRADITYTYPIVGIGWPTEVTSGNLDITCPHLVKDTITYRAAGSLLESTLPDLADVFARQADEFEHDYMIQQRNHQPHNIRRLMPGTAFTRNQGGRITLGWRF